MEVDVEGAVESSTDAGDTAAHQEPQLLQSTDDVSPVNVTDEWNQTLEETLFRLARGLPRHELQMVIHEAMECELALQQEIRVLEAAQTSNINITTDLGANGPYSTILPNEYNPNLQSEVNFLSTAEAIFGTVFAPHDRYFSLSALLGRLREPFTTPPTPHSQKEAKDGSDHLKKGPRKNWSSSQPGGGSSTAFSGDTEKTRAQIAKQKALLELRNNQLYTIMYPMDQQIVLLTVWKRISSHRSALVFRKPVNPDAAPGYREKIQFPMDLSLIRKLITSGYIASFQQLHEYVGLICHNCIKFNGRESDYGMLTREFENYVDECIIDTIQKMENTARALTPGEVGGVTEVQVDPMDEVHDLSNT
jgi:hypothetical protein